MEFQENESFQKDKINILIIGDFTYGTGNLITAQRMRKIFEDLNYKTFFYNIKYLLSVERDNFNHLKRFIVNKKIRLIIGINVWRSGKIIYQLLNDNKICKSIFTF